MVSRSSNRGDKRKEETARAKQAVGKHLERWSGDRASVDKINVILECGCPCGVIYLFVLESATEIDTLFSPVKRQIGMTKAWQGYRQ